MLFGCGLVGFCCGLVGFGFGLVGLGCGLVGFGFGLVGGIGRVGFIPLLILEFGLLGFFICCVGLGLVGFFMGVDFFFVGGVSSYPVGSLMQFPFLERIQRDRPNPECIKTRKGTYVSAVLCFST